MAVQQLALYEQLDEARAADKVSGASSGGASRGEARRAGQASDNLPLSSPRSARVPLRASTPRMCAACREREARYGFRDPQADDPLVDRPKTLCFDCFRMELDHRRQVAEQLAKGWNATQRDLPLANTLDSLHRRRRRAQIAARHALAER